MIGRKTSLTLANVAFGTVLGFVAGVLAARYMGPVPIGQVFFAVNAMGVAYFVTDLGMAQAHVKRVSEGRDPGDCFATFAAFKLVATAVFLALVGGGLWVYVGLLGKPLETTTMPVISIVLVYYLAKSLGEIGQASFDARLETARTQVVQLVDTLVRVSLIVVAALVVAALVNDEGPLDPLVAEGGVGRWVAEHQAESYAIAVAAGSVAASGASLFMLWMVLERGRFSAELLRDYASFAFPLFLVSAVGVISANIDGAALGFFLGASETGIFSQVRRISGVLYALAGAVGTLLFPTISGYAARGDREGITRAMDRSIRYLSMFILPMTAFLVFFAEPVILVALSAEFLPGATALAILAAYIAVVTLAAPHANLLMGMNRPDVAAKIGIATGAAVIVLDLLLIPDDIRSLGIPLAGLGLTGAALGTLASGFLYYGLLRAATWRLAGYRERAHVWKHVVAAGAMSALLLALDRYVLPLDRWYEFGAYAAVGGVAYFALLWAMRELTREDVSYFWDSVHPGEMARYLRDELRSRRR